MIALVWFLVWVVIGAAVMAHRDDGRIMRWAQRSRWLWWLRAWAAAAWPYCLWLLKR